MFDGLDLVLRPQLCQEHKLQIGFLFYSGLVLKRVVVTCTEKISLCVTGVYVRETTDASLLHLNVSGLGGVALLVKCILQSTLCLFFVLKF